MTDSLATPPADPSADPYAELAVIRRLLHESRTWAFVGLGDNPDREVYTQAGLLQKRGKRIIPVHPKAADVLGEKGYASLADVPDASGIDVVGVYRRAEHAGEAVDEAIAAGAKAVWLPLQVIDEAAAKRAKDAGLDVVMNRCPAVEWALRR
ncbi:CoA-binding protein [Actinomadura syzygii]|uniref:CoA-binding protein n=1 Tax=Actinomadura syzygii TaxID=1427538 RepID=A0A5D0TWY6_9ACTN|nr:CoA-binding protein [Actinomadura syzygii]TYC09359.1 CoA-binding protein [Actinomadura syzygii]